MAFTRPFESPRSLLDHARERTDELQRKWEAFLRDNPYVVFEKPDPKIGGVLVVGRFTKRSPLALSNVAFDIASGLRAALDQAVYASAISLGVDEPRNTGFIFGDTEDDLKGEIKRKGKDTHPAIIALMLASRPWKGGHGSLWLLNKARNMKNHRLLVEAVDIATGLTDCDIQLRKGRISILPYIPDLPEGEFAFIHFSTDDNYYYEFYPLLNLLLDDFAGVGRPPAIAFFRHMTETVSSIVDEIETVTRRLVEQRGP